MIHLFVLHKPHAKPQREWQVVFTAPFNAWRLCAFAWDHQKGRGGTTETASPSHLVAHLEISVFSSASFVFFVVNLV
jgi:hypothetical protein